jgi:hypothetical protein
VTTLEPEASIGNIRAKGEAMPAYVGDVKAVCSLPLAALAVLALSAMCAACRSDAEAPAAELFVEHVAAEQRAVLFGA